MNNNNKIFNIINLKNIILIYYNKIKIRLIK